MTKPFHAGDRPRPSSAATYNHVHRGKAFDPPVWSGLTLLEDAVRCLPPINDPDQPYDLGQRLHERDKVREVDGPDGWILLIAAQPRHYRTMRAVAVSNVPQASLPDLFKKAGKLLTDDGVCGVGLAGCPDPGPVVRACLKTAADAMLDLFDVRPGEGDEVRLFLRTVRCHDPLPIDCTLRVYEAMRPVHRGDAVREVDETPARSPAMIPHPGRFSTSKRRES